MKYKHIVWDYNGTILDDTDMVLDVLNGMLKKRGMSTCSMEEYREVFDFPITKYYKDVGFDFSKYTFEELADEFISTYYEKFPECGLREGVADIMEQLKNEGYKQSILTAGRETSVVVEIKNFGLDKYIKKITGLNNHNAESKVHLAKIHLEKIKAHPSEILFIGDTTHDKMVADEIGCDCLLLAGGHQSKRRLQAVNDKVAAEIEDIKKYL